MSDVKTAIASALEKMGVLRSGQKMTAENTKNWSIAVKGQLSPQEIEETADWFAQHANFFPTPHEFVLQAESLRPAPSALRGWDVWGNYSGDWSNCDPDLASEIHQVCWNAHNCSGSGQMPARTEAMLRMMGVRV